MDIKKQLLMEDIRDKMKKFRGKVIKTGKWVYGSLLIVADRTFIIEYKDMMINDDGSLEFARDVFEVDYNTIACRLYPERDGQPEIYELDAFEPVTEIDVDKKMDVYYTKGDILHISKTTLIPSMKTICNDKLHRRQFNELYNITEDDLRTKFRYIGNLHK